jgi:ethanolamine utilization protein EutN
MRIAEVIGVVTLSRAHPSIIGARWIIGVPFSLKALEAGGHGDGEDLVIYDSLGASVGDHIAFSESGEAAAPFYPEKKPVSAYCACILDAISIRGA